MFSNFLKFTQRVDGRSEILTQVFKNFWRAAMILWYVCTGVRKVSDYWLSKAHFSYHADSFTFKMRMGMFCLHLEDWFFQVTAQGGTLNSWHASLNQSTHPLALLLFPRCPGLGFEKEEMKVACLLTKISLIPTLECPTTRTAFSWPSMAIEHWRITCLWYLGQINPHHAHLISEVPGVRHGLCKTDALYCCYYFRRWTRSF